MNGFKGSTFSAIENRIHAARLERSAALGEAIGDTLGHAWFATRRLLVNVAGHAAELKEKSNASALLPPRQRIATPH